MTEDRTPPEADPDDAEADPPADERADGTVAAGDEDGAGEHRRNESAADADGSNETVDEVDQPDADAEQPAGRVDDPDSGGRDRRGSDRPQRSRDRRTREAADGSDDSDRDGDEPDDGALDSTRDADEPADDPVRDGDEVTGGAGAGAPTPGGRGGDGPSEAGGSPTGAPPRRSGEVESESASAEGDGPARARSVAAGATGHGTAAGTAEQPPQGEGAESDQPDERADAAEPHEGAENAHPGDGSTGAGEDAAVAESDVGDLPEDVRSYDRFQKVDRASYDRVNEFLRDRTYVTAREWAIARLCADFRTATGVEMTKIGENLPHLVPFMTDTYSPQAVNQARSAFEEKVRMAGATFLYGAMSGFFTADELDDLMYEVTEVAKFLLEVEGVELTVEEELDAEDRISAVMREVRQASEELRYEEVACPHCGEAFQPAED